MKVTTPEKQLEAAAISRPFLAKLSQTEYRVGIIALILALIARFQALLPGYSIDDYRFVVQSMPSWFDEKTAANGRALSYVLYAALARFNVAPPRAAVLFTILLTLVLVGVGIAACRLWGLSDNFGASLIVVCFVVLHPYQAEMFTFRTASMIVAIPLALAFAATLGCTHSRVYWLVSVVCMACGISIYQGVLNYVTMAILFSVAYQFAHQHPNPGWQRQLRSRLFMVAVATGLYALTTIVISQASGVALGSRTALLGPTDIGTRAEVLVKAAYYLLVSAEPIFPSATKMLLLLTFAAGLVALLFHRQPGTRRRLIILCLTAVAGLPLCYGLILVLQEWYISPRIISQTALYTAGMVAMLYTFSDLRMRRVLTVACALVCLSFIGSNDQVLADQLRVNMRDMAETNRIVQRIEALAGFDEIRTVAVVGGRWGYSSPIQTVQNDINISALFVEKAKVWVLNEFSGYSFAELPTEMEAKADGYCKQAKKWPDSESVIRMDSMAVVCLQPSN